MSITSGFILFELSVKIVLFKQNYNIYYDSRHDSKVFSILESFYFNASCYEFNLSKLIYKLFIIFKCLYRDLNYKLSFELNNKCNNVIIKCLIIYNKPILTIRRNFQYY